MGLTEKQRKLIQFAREMSRTDLHSLVDKYVNELYDMILQDDFANLLSADTASLMANVNFESNIETILAPVFKVNTSLEMFPQEPGVWSIMNLDDISKTDSNSKATNGVAYVGQPVPQLPESPVVVREPLIEEQLPSLADNFSDYGDNNIDRPRQTFTTTAKETESSINGSVLDVSATQLSSVISSPDFTFSTMDTFMSVDISKKLNNDIQLTTEEDNFVATVTLKSPQIFADESECSVPLLLPPVKAVTRAVKTNFEPTSDENVLEKAQKEVTKKDNKRGSKRN